MRRLAAIALVVSATAHGDHLHGNQTVTLAATGLVVMLPTGEWSVSTMARSSTASPADSYDVIARQGMPAFLEVRLSEAASCDEWRDRELADREHYKQVDRHAYGVRDGLVFEQVAGDRLHAMICQKTEQGVLELAIGAPAEMSKSVADTLLAMSASVTAAANAPAAPKRPRLTGPRQPPEQNVVNPTTPDPHNGSFTLREATRGLRGGGPLRAIITTDIGTITCTLAEKEAPIAVANFVGLARGLRAYWDPGSGSWVRRPFYDGLTFHRVMPGFVIQGGDLLGTGMGGTGYGIKNEDKNGLAFDRGGRLGTARGADPDSAGGQFFITDGVQTHLNQNQTIFGDCGPADVIHKLAAVPADDTRPKAPLVIDSVMISR